MQGKNEVITQPAEEPVTLTQAKLHLRVDGSDDDALITTYIKAARSWAEGFLGRSIVTQTRRQHLDDWPESIDDPIELQFSNVQSVTSVKYYDVDGVLQTLAPTMYDADLVDSPAKISLVDGEIWPTTKTRPNAIQIEYVAGYGLPSTALPKPIPDEIPVAILHLVATWYATRESVVTGTIVSAVPQTCENLLWPLRIIAL